MNGLMQGQPVYGAQEQREAALTCAALISRGLDVVIAVPGQPAPRAVAQPHHQRQQRRVVVAPLGRRRLQQALHALARLGTNST